MRRTIFVMTALALGAPAFAGVFTVKTMRSPLPAQEVERELTMAKGWVEFGFGYDHKVSASQWTADGEVEEWKDTKWTHGTGRFEIRYGIAGNAEIWWSVPYHFGHLTNEALGTDTSDHALGDPWFGWRYSLYSTDAPLTSVVVDVATKGPASKEAPGSYIGGPHNVSGFVFGTGTPDLYLGLGAKRQFGPLGIVAHAGYTKRFSGLVQYLIDVTYYSFSGRIKPGDQIKGDLGIMIQAGPINVGATALAVHRFETRIGTTAPGINPGKDLRAVNGSDGFALDTRVDLTAHITRGFDINAYALIPLAGEDLQFFPIEDIHPTRGTTFGGTVELRY